MANAKPTPPQNASLLKSPEAFAVSQLDMSRQIQRVDSLHQQFKVEAERAQAFLLKLRSSQSSPASQTSKQARKAAPATTRSQEQEKADETDGNDVEDDDSYDDVEDGHLDDAKDSDECTCCTCPHQPLPLGPPLNGTRNAFAAAATEFLNSTQNALASSNAKGVGKKSKTHASSPTAALPDPLRHLPLGTLSRVDEREVRDLEKRVRGLEGRVRGFEGMPPDREIALQEVERLRRELEGLARRREGLFEGLTAAANAAAASAANANAKFHALNRSPHQDHNHGVKDGGAAQSTKAGANTVDPSGKAKKTAKVAGKKGNKVGGTHPTTDGTGTKK